MARPIGVAVPFRLKGIQIHEETPGPFPGPLRRRIEPGQGRGVRYSPGCQVQNQGGKIGGGDLRRAKGIMESYTWRLYRR